MPLPGTIAIVSHYYMIIAAFVPLAFAELKGAHISVEVVTDEADPALVKKTQAFIEQDMKTLVDYFVAKHGLKRGDEMIKGFRPVLEKWVKLVQPVDSVEKLGDLYWKEIYSKVDVAKHGM